jgi:luciferase family oxidoreductase group 1
MAAPTNPTPAGQRPLRLSVLDQSPVPTGSSPAQALANSLSLAQHVDRLGYTRLWYSEHHAMPMLAGSAPELLIARAAAATGHIRIGSGGIMLPHYSAFKVAEVFRTLHAMFPGRIDLGIGRAPGGGQLESYALRRSRNTPPADDFPLQLAELRAFLNHEQWAAANPEHTFARLHIAPAPDDRDAPGAPDLWLLGSSMWSAVTAADQGLPYAFAHFFSPIQTREAIEFYQRNFRPSQIEGSGRQQPEATLCIGVICADTQAEAEHLHASVRLLQRRIRMGDRRPLESPEDALRELAAPPVAPNPLLPFTAGSLEDPDGEWPRYLVGTPDRVATALHALADDLQLSELLINTITHSHAARLRSYTLLAEAIGLATAPAPPAAERALR